MNIQFNGEPRALGYFSHGMDDIGFEEGLLLTTGEAFQADRPNVNIGFGATNESTAESPELENLSSSEVKDVLEYVITFIPTTDSIVFNYRFASEEYPEFSIDCFHDVFGFFIFGPGIPTEGQNIAVVPGTDLPVSVNTIHPLDTEVSILTGCPPLPVNEPRNEHLYIDNTDSPNLEYDGFTQTLLATAKVIPCQEYTLKLVIADVHDDLYDSAVFLESRSFSSSNFNTDLMGVGLDGSIVEGCSSADIVFSIPTPRADDYEINFVKIGSATAGEDFNDFPNSVIIPAGDLSTSFSIEAIVDETVEPNDSIGIEIQIAPCLSDTIWIPVKDAQLELPDLGNDLSICAGDSVQIVGPTDNLSDSVIVFEEIGINEQIREVQEDRSDPINNEPSLFNITVQGIEPAEVVPGLINSVCINILHVEVEQLDVFLQSPNGRFIELTTDNGGLSDHYLNTCFTPTATTPIQQGMAPYTGDFLPEGNFNTFYGDDVNGTWTLIVRDDDGIGGTTSLKGTITSWSINFNNDYRIEYEWDQVDSISCIDCTDPIVFPSETTTYTLNATDTYGCTASNDITVNVQQPLATPVANCSNIARDALTIEWEPVVGALNYSININEAGWITPTGQFQHRITGLAEGETVNVELRANSDGSCSTTAEFLSCATVVCTIPLPALDSIKNVSCNEVADGQIFVSTPVDAFFILDNDTSALGKNVVFDSLPSGTYKIYIFESSKICSDTLNVTIDDPIPLNLQIIENQAPSCFGTNDGIIAVDGSGGTGLYNYSWTNLNDSTFSATDIMRIETLAKGAYQIILTDANNCEDQQLVTILDPESTILDTISRNESCFESGDGSISINANPIYNNLNFSWNNGATTAAIDNLSVGNYSVTVQNEVGCEENRNFTITTPPPITITEENTKLESCTDKRDGSITVQAAGGRGNFSYLWDDDEKQTTATATNLPSGNYLVVATDKTGCRHNFEVSLDALEDITIDTTLRGVSCFEESDGEILLTLTGGTPNYIINWSDNEGDNLIERTDLAAGNYQVIVSDVNDCSTDLKFTIADKAPINLTSTQDLASCNGSDGQISVSIIDGTGDYTFQWADDNTRTTAIAENLAQGEYSVTVFDQAGCSASEIITLREEEGVQLATTTTPILCTMEMNGTATVVARGGTGNYQYLWTDEAATEQPTVQNLAAGNYTVLVRDDLGCETTEIVTIIDNSITVNLSLDKKDISCFGGTDGAIISTVSNEISNLRYQWSNGETQSNLMNIDTGNYQLTVTDANNCEHTADVTISEPAALAVETILDSISCPNDGDGVFRILPSGGTAPYLFSIDGNRYTSTSEFSNLLPGRYEPAIRDDNNCVVSIAPFELVEALPLSITLDNLKLKENESTEIIPIINNGKGIPIFIWTGNDLADLSCVDCPNPTIIPTNSQLYNLLVIDEVGCEAAVSFSVLVEKNRTIYIPTIFSPNSDGLNDRLTVHGVDNTQILSFKIFDRWGELVFENQSFSANDESAGWDGFFRGEPMPSSVFTWVVEVRFFDDTIKLVTGNSTLIR